MAKHSDELDRTRPEDEDVRNLERDEFEAAEEGDEGDLDDDSLENERLTGEVGSEGGSPGEQVRTNPNAERVRGGGGSEATETVRDEE